MEYLVGPHGKFSLQCGKWPFPISLYLFKFYWPAEMKMFSNSQENKQILARSLKVNKMLCMSPHLHVPPAEINVAENLLDC